MQNKKVLFLSYDGMTDPLGQSQVIPYMAGLAKQGYEVSIISFEKNDKLARLGEFIKRKMKDAGLKWHPLKFHSSPPKLSKWWDVRLMNKKAASLHKAEQFDIIHCRSYIAAGVGLKLKRRTGVKMLFDMRGFWPDEKADGGSWNKKNLFWRFVYNYYKKKEKEFILKADHLITLTYAAKEEIESWDYYRKEVPITVIPCCADETLFSLTSVEEKREARRKANLPDQAFVLGYLGSVGAWYMLEEMLLFFTRLKIKRPDAIFFFITNTESAFIASHLPRYNLKEDRDVKIMQVNYQEVPSYMKASDTSISFIKPVYSKKGSSPVKLGETLCMGIPVIVNNIGDNSRIIEECNAGFVTEDFSAEQFDRIAGQIDDIVKLDKARIREKALLYYGLRQGIEKYFTVYKRLVP